MTATISARFAEALADGGPHTRRDEPARLLGLEQEFAVRDGGGGVIDFGQVLARRPDAGRRLDPADPLAARRASGIVVTADGAEAEAAIPPLALRPGFTFALDRWAELARDEIAAVAPARSCITGYSTHLSVSVGAEPGHADRIARLFATTFAPALLSGDRSSGPADPGLFSRPRHERVEIGFPFLDGPALRAAALLAAGGVAACEAAVDGRIGADALPPAVQVRLVPSVHRYGWYLARDALAGDGRRLRTLAGRRVDAREHADLARGVAAATLGEHAGATDLAPLLGPPVAPVGTAAPAAPRELVALLGPRHRPDGLSLDAVAATWDFAVLRFGTPRTRSGFACVPRPDLAAFFERLDRGELDDLLLAFVDTPPGRRRLEHFAQTTAPGLFDEVRVGPNLTPPERDRAGTATRAFAARSSKRDAAVERLLGGDPADRPGCRPRHPWLLAAAGALGLAAAAGAWAFGGDGGSTASPETTTAAATGPVCGDGLEGPVYPWIRLTERCTPPPGDPTAVRYRVDTTALEVTAVDVASTPRGTAVCVCVDHARRSTDPVTGRPGLSTVLVATSGIPPGALVDLGIDGPGGPWSGRGVAGAEGYAVVEIPIDVPGRFRVERGRYFPGGDPAGPAVDLDLPGLFPDPEIDASDLSSRCDVQVMLDWLADETARKEREVGDAGEGGADAAARRAGEAVVEEAAGLLPIIEVLRGPGTDVSVAGPYSVVASGDRVDLTTPRGPLDLGWTPAGGFHGAWSTAGATPEVAARWFEALPCGAGQLAVGACTGAPGSGGSLPDGEWLVVGVAPRAAIPIGDPDRDWSLRVTVGTREYVAAPDGHGDVGLQATGAPTAARMFVRDDAALLVAPVADLGAIELGTVVEAAAELTVATAGGGQSERFPVGASATAPFGGVLTITPPPVSASAGDASAPAEAADPAQLIAEFVPQLYRALAEHDPDSFAFDHLDPAVVERYGAEQCRSYVTSREHEDGLEVEVRGVGEADIYEYVTDGVSTAVDDVYAVDLTMREAGETTDRTAHIGVGDHGDAHAAGEANPTWFTDCGEPLPPAGG